MDALPRSLISIKSLNELIEILLEKDGLRKSLNRMDFGKPVTTEEDADNILRKIALITRRVLEIDCVEIPEPKIVLTRRLSQLSHLTARLYLLFLPLCLFLFFLTVPHHANGGFAVWTVWLAILFLLFFPFIYRRRVRLNIEHECGYRKNAEHRPIITIDQLPSIQFQSYLSHEYAHHLYYHYFGTESDEWVREGWARFVQWQVVQHLCREEKNPAYTFHVVAQIIGELKFACSLISMVMRIRLPSHVRKIRSIYQGNTLINFFAGSPGYNIDSLIVHAAGTAVFFLAERQIGSYKTLWDLPCESDHMLFDN
jgi:hypothetical protein